MTHQNEVDATHREVEENNTEPQVESEASDAEEKAEDSEAKPSSNTSESSTEVATESEQAEEETETPPEGDGEAPEKASASENAGEKAPEQESSEAPDAVASETAPEAAPESDGEGKAEPAEGPSEQAADKAAPVEQAEKQAVSDTPPVEEIAEGSEGEASAEEDTATPGETSSTTKGSEPAEGESAADEKADEQVEGKPAEEKAAAESTENETSPAEPEKEVAAAAGAQSEDASSEDGSEEPQEESFEALLEQYDQFRQYRPGDLVKGTVVSVGDQEVLLDIGARVEGMIPASELQDQDGNFTVKDGDTLRAMVCRFTPDGQYIPLSFERARVSRVWDDIEEIANKEKQLEGTVIEKVKGGFIVDVGVRAFLPTSQATLKPQKDLQSLLGKKFEFTILKIQRRRGNLILSRKDILQSEFEEMRKTLFEKLQEGAVLQGVVKNITDYGAFIDLGGLDGLLHITDMSWGRVNHPKDLVELNQEIEVKVLRFDPEKEKVSLGLKQCTPDPWLSVSDKYPPGTVAEGKVLNLTTYGAFVELEPGVEGMIHVSEMSWTKKIRNPAQVLNKGQEVKVKVLDLDAENRRVSLSLKQTEDNPWDTLAERFPVGSKVTGKVRNITDFGAFVEIEDGIDGLVHVSDFKWGERNADPNEYVTKGQEVEVVILAVDTDNRKVSLGIKQLEKDPWIEFTNNHRNGQVITGPITKITDFGVFVQLAEHVEGLIRQGELDDKKDATENLAEGQEIQAMISRISHKDRKVDLSRRKLHQKQERQAIMEYTKKNDSGGATFGDISPDLKKLIK